jgi:hypothetical protein
VETAGKFDGDVEINVWSTGIRQIRIDFASANVDIYQLQQFLSRKVTTAKTEGMQDAIDSEPPKMDKKQTTAGNIIDWFGDNAKQVSASEIEDTFKTTIPVLLQNEKVEIAFKSGRDFPVFSKLHVIQLIDVQGVFRKKIEILSILW